MSWGNRWVAYDVATAGYEARVVAVAFALFERGKLKEQWASLVRPPTGLREKDVEGLGYLPDWDGAPSFMGVFHRLYSHFRSSDVWVSYDVARKKEALHREFACRGGFQFRRLLELDIKELSFSLHRNEHDHSLSAVAARWGIFHPADTPSSVVITCGSTLSVMLRNGCLPVDIGDMLRWQEGRVVPLPRGTA